MPRKIPCVVIRKKTVLRDEEPEGKPNRLEMGKNGRKILAIELRPDIGEIPLDKPEWEAPKVLATGNGGLEISHFTEYSIQDRHKHDLGTEIYTVLKGTMEILINDTQLYVLDEGDEIVILPNTVHQVLQKNLQQKEPNSDFKLLVRVHSISCYGESDKFVQLEAEGLWHCWAALTPGQRQSAWKINRKPG